MFIKAPPAVGAPLLDWRAGFETIAPPFEPPADAPTEPANANSIPRLKISAPGTTPSSRISTAAATS